MQIGLHGFGEQDLDMVQDLGVQWVKFTSGPIEGAELPDLSDCLALADRAGLEVIIDIRTDRPIHMEIAREFHDNGASDAYHSLACHLADKAAALVSKYQSRVKHWEFWGEYPCPYVSGFQGNTDAYPLYLVEVARRIREVAPDVRIWNGGYGVDFQVQFLKGLLQDGACDAFDVVNWHHYNLQHMFPKRDDGTDDEDATLAERVANGEAKYRAMFAKARELLAEAGGDKPFGSTEWGIPIVRDNEQVQRFFKSFVLDGDVPALFDSESVAFMDAWLNAFDECGFQVLCYHAPRDWGGQHADDTHWGGFCGLLWKDGTPKQVYDVVKRYAQKGRGVPVQWN